VWPIGRLTRVRPVGLFIRHLFSLVTSKRHLFALRGIQGARVRGDDARVAPMPLGFQTPMTPASVKALAVLNRMLKRWRVPTSSQQ
jgi:hypothetical protein